MALFILRTSLTLSPFPQLSGKEQLLDLWILSRLSETVALCDRAFRDYEFTVATTACYNFWLYDLCDIYLVGVTVVTGAIIFRCMCTFRNLRCMEAIIVSVLEKIHTKD